VSSPTGEANSAAARAGESRIELGRDSATGSDGQSTLAQRVDRFIAGYPLIVAQGAGPPPRIDARYPNGLAVTPAKSSAGKPERVAQP
jgi:hypothetical protein